MRGTTSVLSNNGLHQTGARRCGPRISPEGQSLSRAPAGEAGCSTDDSWEQEEEGMTWE